MTAFAVLLVATAAGPAAGAPGKGRGQGHGNAVGQGNGSGQANGKGVGKGNGKAVGKQPPPTTADPSANPAYALPPWNDAQWGSSEEYDTIQTADIDGDGDHELLGRDSTGLQAWDFDGAAGQWAPLYVGGSGFYTDAHGWEKKYHYETIGAADLDGDGDDDVYGRGVHGIEAYAWDAATAGWTTLPDLAEFTNAQGWTGVQYYRTIQAADLDGDGRDEILGRGASAVVIADLDDGGWRMSFLPEFTDAQGWDHERYYSTIQTGDLDGDGRDEILGRGGNGMTVWGLASTGDWVVEATSGPFTDAQGWDKYEYYSTIQTGDLDGDGDLDVFGRGANGVIADRFADTGKERKGGTWAGLPVLPEMTDAQGWDHERYYATIQAADLDGDGRDEVIGRGAHNLYVWGLHQSTKHWSDEQQVAEAGLSDALGWDHARSYRTIRAADVDGFTPIGSPGSATAPREELIGRGPTGISTYRFDAKSGAWESPTAGYPTFGGSAKTAYVALSNQLSPAAPSGNVRAAYDTEAWETLETWAGQVAVMAAPSGVSRTTWQHVQAQVGHELRWASQVGELFTNQSQKIDDVKELEGLDDTANYLDYKTDSSTNILGELLVLFTGFADAASNLGDPEMQVLFGGIASFASFAYSAGQPGESSFDGRFSDLDGKLEASWGLAQTATEQARQAVVADYGLLSTVGGLLEDGTWPILSPSDPGWARSTNLAARAYSTWVWQTLTPTLPKPCFGLESCGGWIISWCGDSPCDATRGGWAYQLAVTDCSGNPCRTDGLEALDISVSRGVPHDLREQLLGTTSQDCLAAWDPSTCNLGVPEADVFLGRNGWAYACTVNGGEVPDSFCDTLIDEAAEYGSP